MNGQNLNRLLNNFTVNNVQLRKHRKTEALNYWQPIVHAVIDSVKRRDRRFASSHIFHTGSYYDGSKVGEPDEFDMMLVMDNLALGDDEPYEEDDGMIDPPIGFTRVMIDRGEEMLWQQDNCVNARGMLNAQQLKAVFVRLVRDSIRTLGQQYSRCIEVKTHGPAVTLEITNRNNRRKYSIDVVLAIKDKHWPDDAEEWKDSVRRGWPNRRLIQEIYQDGCYLVAKQPKGGRIPDQEKHFLWLYSFAAAEKKLLREGSHGEASSCRKLVFRILKALKEELNWQPLKSFHLKMMLFYECEENPLQWSSEHISHRFIGLLNRLENCLRHSNCPHYFIRNFNLFEFFPRQRCAELADSVQRVRDNPQNYLE